MPHFDPNYKPPKSYAQLNGDGTVTLVGKAWNDAYHNKENAMSDEKNEKHPKCPDCGQHHPPIPQGLKAMLAMGALMSMGRGAAGDDKMAVSAGIATHRETGEITPFVKIDLFRDKLNLKDAASLADAITKCIAVAKKEAAKRIKASKKAKAPKKTKKA